jgi:SPP1 gp7 family putative phage head morphogenesis protein
MLRRLSGAARVAQYKGFNARRDREASRVRATVAQWYDGLEADVLARLEANKSLLASRVKAPSLAALLFSAADGEKNLTGRIIPVLADLFQRTGQQALAEIAVGLSFSLENPRAREILAQRTLEMKTVTATAQESCRASLAEGLANGETIEQLTGRVEQWAEAGRIGHAENVARTETGVCMNQASLEGYREGGAQSKEWLAISDATSREWHASMDGVIVGIDENFELETGSFNGPGDPSMDAGDACRGRCAIAPVVEAADGTVTEGDPVGGAEE